MSRRSGRGGIILQVAVLFIVGILLSGLITYFGQHFVSEARIREQTEELSDEISREVAQAVTEYPAWAWLLRYWHVHADELDIEYDAVFSTETETAEKCSLFYSRYPGTDIHYYEASELDAMPQEDQKLYAEIVYSWLITRINEIKRAYGADYLFCVITDDLFETQFFLASASDEGAVRGQDYGEVYTLGVVSEVSQSQSEAMRDAYLHQSHLAEAGDYLDYYGMLGEANGNILLIGLTYDLNSLRAEVSSDATSGTLTAVLFQIVLSALCLALIYFFVLRPLKKVQSSIRGYAQTKDSLAAAAELSAIRSHNEIGQLSDDVAALAAEIDGHMKRIETITAEKERIDTEMELAARIQEDILPGVVSAFSERTDFDIFAAMDPAREVGGDFYDFFLIDDTHLGMAVADVSGKGIPAALFMMGSKIALKNYAMSGLGPAEVLRSLNEELCANDHGEMFVTVWFGVLDTSTGVMRAANAGHEYPVLKDPDGSFELLKDKHSFVVGGMKGMAYKEYTIELKPGSRLFLYTDGVPEAENGSGDMFGLERMIRTLNTDPEASPEQILRNVRSQVDGFVQEAEQFDDLTMLCLEYRGEQTDQAAQAVQTTFEKEMEASVEELPELLAFLDAHLEEAGCSRKALFQIDVAAEEIFVNIANYAYAPGTGRVLARLCIPEGSHTAEISFTDSGMPYDPLKRPDPDITLSAEEREIGGLGVYMVKKTMDDVSYEYKDGRNILTIRKTIC